MWGGFLSLKNKIEKCFCASHSPVLLWSFAAVVILISIICGTFVFYTTELLSCLLPGFCLPPAVISIMVLFTHIILALILCTVVFDNFRCPVSRLYAAVILLIYAISVAYMNLFFRYTCVAVGFMLLICILALHAYLLLKNTRGKRLFIMLVLSAAVYIYLLLITLFTLL